MKILGVILTYNNLEFFKCALEQALDFCDELILIEGGHLQNRPKRSTDGTVEYIQTISNPKLVIIDDWEYKGRNDDVQCYLRENYANQSPLWEPGNWICQWDDDIAFFNDDLPIIKQVMKKTKRDLIRFKERMFIYNFRFNLYKNSVGAYHFDKITEGCYYTPMWKMHYKNGSFYRDKKYEYLKKIDYFHYSFVRKPERLKIRLECSYEKGYKNSFERYNKFMSVKWEEDEDIFKSQDIIEDLTNYWGFNIYNGPHPKIMDGHPWRYVKDTRVG